MEKTDATVFMRHAREEILLALDARNARDEHRHKKLANSYMTRAVRQFQHEPDRKHDWGELCP